LALHLTAGSQPQLQLRSLDPANPVAGRSLLLSAQPNAPIECPAGLQLYELFVLQGSLTLNGQPLAEGDHATLPPLPREAVLQAGPQGARLFTVWIEPIHFPESVLALDHRAETLAHSWGYLDLQDQTDRLPLRWERTRGEATWLLQWPPGHTGIPTRAQNVGLELLVLSGDLTPPDQPSLQSDHYIYLQPGALTPGWRTQNGCRLLLRTIAFLLD